MTTHQWIIERGTSRQSCRRCGVSRFSAEAALYCRLPTIPGPPGTDLAADVAAVVAMIREHRGTAMPSFITLDDALVRLDAALARHLHRPTEESAS